MDHPLLIPYALHDSTGRIVHVDNVPRGADCGCICFGCRSPLIARKGQVRRHHFAHKSPAEKCAAPDTALHKTAIALIEQSFHDAMTQRDEYRLGVWCSDCGTTPLAQNVAFHGTSVSREVYLPLAGNKTYPDLLFTMPNGKRVIVEIVVNHEPDAPTHDAYLRSSIRVLIVRPTWDTLNELTDGVISSETLGSSNLLCAKCKDSRRRKAEVERHRVAQVERERREREKTLQMVDRALTRMDNRVPSNEALFQPWTRITNDWLPNQVMFPYVRKRVYANAIILTELGFKQARTNKWVFYFRVPVNGVIFAGLDGDIDTPIWKRPGVNISGKFPIECSCEVCDYGHPCCCPIIREYNEEITGKVKEKLRAAHVVLLDDCDGSMDNSRHPKYGEVLRYVRSSVLSKLLDDAEMLETTTSERQTEEKPETLQGAIQPRMTGEMDANAIISYAEAMPRAKWQRFVGTKIGIVDLETGAIVG